MYVFVCACVCTEVLIYQEIKNNKTVTSAWFPSWVSLHCLEVFQTPVTLTSSVLSKSTSLAMHGWWLRCLNSLFCATYTFTFDLPPFPHCLPWLGFSSSLVSYRSSPPLTPSKVASDVLAARFYLSFERPLQTYKDKNNNMKDVLLQIFFKSCKNSRKKSIRITMVTTNNFICKKEIK